MAQIEAPPITDPLLPLTTAELAVATRVLREREAVTPDRYRFVQISLLEPPKLDLLAYLAGDGPGPDRRAQAVLIDRDDRRTVEATIDLHRGAITEWTIVGLGQPPFTITELLSCEQIVRDDPDFQAALARRGLTDVALVWVDPWSAGAYHDEPDLRERRWARGLIWAKRGADEINGYAHPVENLIVLFDLYDNSVIRVEDHGVVPVPMTDGEYGVGTAGPARPGLKPLVITQPDGASFTVDGNQVRWQNWHLRVGFNAREGLTLHTIGWQEGDTVRPVLFRASVSEMVVPYGDPTVTHMRKNAFDIGELNLGALANSLTLGCDCLGLIHYFDAALVDDRGQPFVLKNAICMHEEDYGVLWRHLDWRSGQTEIRRSRRLVISSFSTIGNYDYGFFWYFYQDGSIEAEVKLTGIMSTGAIAPGVTPTHGQRLTMDGLYAPIHQHFFSYRLDFDIDGQRNTVHESHAEIDAPSAANPMRNGFHTVRTALRTEQAAQQLIDPLRGRVWRIVNPHRRNAVGEPTAYRLVPHSNVSAFAAPDASISQRATFMTKHLWVTPHADAERYAAGEYPNQHPGGAGLPEWTAADRNIEDTDLVVWYTLGSHHAPRLEDWPVMPVAYAGFLMQPAGFFDRNPALDVAPPTPQHATAASNGHCAACD